MAGFYRRLSSDARARARERLNEIEFKIELNQKLAAEPEKELEPKPKKSKVAAKDCEEFDDLIIRECNQFEASAEPLRTLLNEYHREYRRYICEQAAICIQQSFRKYLLLIKKTSIRSKKRSARGEPLAEKCGPSAGDRCAKDRSDNWPDGCAKEHTMEHAKEWLADRRSANACDPDEKCKVGCIHRSLCNRACSDECDPNCDGNCNASCNTNNDTNCHVNCIHDHCPVDVTHSCCGSSTNSLDGTADGSKESPSDCCSVRSSSPHARYGHPTEGSFKSKKNELLNCSMDIDMCATKDENPFESFESDEIKGKRCSPSSASLSCMGKLSAKR